MKGNSQGKRFDKTLFLNLIIFAPIVILSIIFQVSFLDVFGKTPAIALALVCAIGFLAGEKAGGIFGVCSGFLLDMLGGIGFSFSPVFYMLAGYICGCLPKVFLKRNFLSFCIYSIIVGICRGCMTLMIYTLRTRSFNIIKIFSKTLVPEFFAFIVFIPIAYLICFGITRLTNRSKH